MQKESLSSPRIIISGGGTGGHIFPAIAIANGLKKINQQTEILFIGAQDRMEMQKIPEAGYNIKGLWISGLQRRLTVDNLSFPFKVISSLIRSNRIIKEFKPDAIVGVGGYSSGPVLFNGTRLRIPTLVQEQNSFPGITNRLLANKVDRICVAYENMNRFFPQEKLKITGNPVREDIAHFNIDRTTALEKFGLDIDKKTVLVIGGSLGAKTINDAMFESLDLLIQSNIQVIWQTGSGYFKAIDEKISDHQRLTVKIYPFLKDMKVAYGAVEMVVSRAGAISISEICCVGKACILVPSPNVSEDHQTKNAQSLVDKSAAVLVSDNECRRILGNKIVELLSNESLVKDLGANIKAMAKVNATDEIVHEVLNLIQS